MSISSFSKHSNESNNLSVCLFPKDSPEGIFSFFLHYDRTKEYECPDEKLPPPNPAPANS